MSDDYTPTLRDVRALYVAEAGDELQTEASVAAEFDRFIAALRAEWEAESGETLREIEKFLSDGEEVGRINDPSERFGTPAEKAAGVVDRAWRTGLRRILTPVTNTESESEGKA